MKKTSVIKVSVLMSILLTCAYPALSQYQSTPPPCLARFGGPHYRFPQPNTLPVGPNSPIELKRGYAVLDSVTHSIGMNTLYGWIAARVMDDTVEALRNHFYRMVDHDPVSFLRYIGMRDTSFFMSPGKAIALFQDRLRVISRYPIEDLLLCGSAWIVKGIVSDRVAGYDSLGAIAADYTALFVNVIDTIKGQVIPKDGLVLDVRGISLDQLRRQGADSLDACLPSIGDTCFFFMSPVALCGTQSDMYFSLIPSSPGKRLKSPGYYIVRNGRIRCSALEFVGLTEVTEADFVTGVERHIRRITE
jgi:hypothetical protein